MTKLKNLKGTAIQFLDADPVVYAGTWASGGNLNTARTALGGAGSTSAGIVFGGRTPGIVSVTETYNGTAFTEVADLNVAKGSGGSAGYNTSTVAIYFAGATPAGPRQNTNEKWNGSAWTEVADMNESKNGMQGGMGTSTAATHGGGQTSGGNVNSTEVWDNSSWTEVNNMNTARSNGAQMGATYTAGISAGGIDPSNPTAVSESWNGTSWTETNDLNTARTGLKGFGTSTSAVVVGGDPHVTNVETWDGTSWSEANDISVAATNRSQTSGLSGSGGGFAAGGQAAPGSPQAITEEWSFPPATASTLQEGDMWFNSDSSVLKGYGTAAGIPAGVWSAGGTMNSGREQGADFGSLSAGVAAGGGGSSVDVEEYNGTSWTEVNNIPAGGASGGATGTQTAGIIYGFKNSSPVRVDVMTYDGTTFTEVNNLNTGRNAGGSAGGVQTAALYAGGGSSDANTEIWNGSTWTEVNDLNDGRYVLKGGGTTTAAVLAGGYGGSPSTNPTQSEQWNGTSWTEGNNLNSGRAYLTGGGSEYTSVMIFGGGPMPGVSTKTEFWNGTTWTEMNDMATASETSHGTTQGTGLGTYRARTPSAAGETEEWTVGAAVVTVTTS